MKKQEEMKNEQGMSNNTENVKSHQVGWLFLERNQKEVARKILGKDYQMVKYGGWGYLDEFFIFMKKLGLFNLPPIKGEGFQRKMFALTKIILLYQMKVLFSVPSMNQIPDTLFQDIGLLEILGFTGLQIKNGFCKRGQGKHNGPMHKDTLADALAKFSPSEIEEILNYSIKILARNGLVSDSKFIADSTPIQTTSKCKGCGCKAVKEKHVNKNKEIVEIEKLIYGFKLLVIRGVESNICVAAKLVQIQEHESQYLLEIIKKAQENLNKKRLGTLLIDRGFIDGVNLWKVKHEFYLDFIIPCKTNMEITNDARGLKGIRQEGIYYQEREIKEKVKVEGKDKEKDKEKEKLVDKSVAIIGIENLTSYEEYGDEEHQRQHKLNRYKKEEYQGRKKFMGNPLNVIMVTKWKGKEYSPGKEKVFLTTLPVNNPLEILDLYDLRSLIENTTFRELKQGWLINKIPKKTFNAVNAHVLLTLSMFNLTNAYRTEKGQEIAQKGIRSYRIKNSAKTRDKIIVIAIPYYAIFDLEEFAVLVGNGNYKGNFTLFC